jgi:battenin
LTPWRSVVLTLLWLYTCRNFAQLVGLESPEPLANLYNRAYFRATWVTTALDAGFWSAMRIRNKTIRDLASIIFTVYYLIAAEQADEKVRKVRAVLTVDHLRVSWNKPNTPYLSRFTALLRPRFTKYKPRRIRIPRPRQSHYREPVVAWMYFDGSLAELEKQENLVLDIPGGGFVAMDPRTSDDRLLAWAGKTGLPILSLDYRKAPEYPYPYALNECFDVYTQIVTTRGRCVGMKPDCCPRIVLSGDSAGGNLATGTTLMVIQSNQTGASSRGVLPSPAGLVLLYPSLDFNISSWMTDDQMALIRNPRTAKKYDAFIKRKSEDIDRRYTPTTPKPSDDVGEDDPSHDFFAARDSNVEEKAADLQRHDTDVEAQRQAVALSKPQPLRTRLAVSSIISYFGDRILTPEMMRAMIILYVGPYNRPDFTTDHLLCPAVAPETLLAKFPKTYFLTGERDPLVDDTVIFAGRLRQAKLHLFRERQEVGLEKSTAEFDEKDHVEVTLISGISHGFVQFVSVFPEGWKHIFRCASWIQEIFDKPPHAFEGPSIESRLRTASLTDNGSSLELASTTRPLHHRRTPTGSESLDDDDAPLVMSSLKTAAADDDDETTGVTGSSNGTARGPRGRRPPPPPPPPNNLNRSKSLVSLGSEEDLLKRRMKGLTTGLMGSNGV